MNRRELFKTFAGGIGSRAGRSPRGRCSRAGRSRTRGISESPRPHQIRRRNSSSTRNMKTFPPDVIELGKKSILDGFGLALAGSASVMGPIARKYVESFGSSEMRASIIGTGMKAHPRFASFLNGVSIHADDFDDTQLSAAKDRIYGLLTHPTVSVLPPAFALCELGHRSGKDFMAGVSHGRGSRDQNRRGHRPAAL